MENNKETITCYSFQSVEFYHELLQKGSIQTDWNRVEKDMIPSYNWMLQQYNQRLKRDASSLVWIFDEIPHFFFPTDSELAERKIKKDFYDYERVMFAFEIPSQHILWSDYDAFNNVIMDIPLLSEEELDEEENGKIFPSHYGWERAFDFPWLQKEYGLYLNQGVIGKISATYIKDVQLYHELTMTWRNL